MTFHMAADLQILEHFGIADLQFAAFWLLGQCWLAIPELCSEVTLRFHMAEARMDGERPFHWLAGISSTSCNKLLQICNLQHSGCWLAIPGLCSEVSHGRSQNGWGKDPWRNFQHFGATSCNKLLHMMQHIFNFATVLLIL